MAKARCLSWIDEPYNPPAFELGDVYVIRFPPVYTSIDRKPIGREQLSDAGPFGKNDSANHCRLGLHRIHVRYLEDFAVGRRFPTPSVEITETDIKTFAVKFDPQSMHLDVDAARRGPLGGLSASGWHTTALVMRLIVEANLFDGGPVLGLGVDDLRWPAPVRPGDTLSAEIEVVSITPSKSKPSQGVLRVHVRARNQNGDVVLSMFPNLWVPRKAH